MSKRVNIDVRAWLVVGPKGSFLTCNLHYHRAYAIDQARELRAVIGYRFKVVPVRVSSYPKKGKTDGR